MAPPRNPLLRLSFGRQLGREAGLRLLNEAIEDAEASLARYRRLAGLALRTPPHRTQGAE